MRILSKAARLSCALSLLAVLLSGCWDRTETNDLAFVLTTSIDLEESGLYRVAFLLPLPGEMGGAGGGGGGTGGSKSYYIDSDVGKTYLEATVRLQNRMPRRLFLSHRRTIVVGEALAKHGIKPLFDSSPRLPESRLNTYIVVAKGKGYDLLNSEPSFERFSAEAIRELARPPIAMATTIKDLSMTLSNNNDPIVAYMQATESKKGVTPSKEIEFIGYAQFQLDKMIGVYKDEAANGLAWLRDKVMDHIISFPIEPNKDISILVTDGRSYVTPNIKNGELSFDIDMEIVGKVREDASGEDLGKSSATENVENKLAAYTKQTIQTTIKQMQEKGTDSAHLKTLVWRRYPYEWKHGLEANWNELFKKATFHIKAKASITETGLINRNLIEEGT
ncbi:Ger(x)C family spore germination protein [Paenibacillus eucommiae]|uniref:Spore germination protein KC/spore germination protein n=1 Tax=Paenibacillus eucommiae TaxID=1355755 RepID=A0ABS4J5E3_9BACL|nr:Ger(x)C family spore germination protein [Paenibacillus eucommiae]MBP1995008.1 spore germination protein KC/spore germination protein [Paenibacillus eucommiae]